MAQKRILITGHLPLHDNYGKMLMRCGAIPVYSETLTSVSSFDGLILPGGYDIAPSLYGQANSGSNNIDIALDLYQMDMLRRFAAEQKPILAICKGLQLVNVFFGGILCQHMPYVKMHQYPHKDIYHKTRIAEGSFLHKIYQTTSLTVNSNHHQAILTPGKHLIPIQWSGDGSIEAMEHLSLPIWCVQWHPERMTDCCHISGMPLFQAFLRTCKNP